MDHLCLADKAGYGQCILDKNHEGTIHVDAHGHKFCTACDEHSWCYDCASAAEVKNANKTD